MAETTERAELQNLFAEAERHDATIRLESYAHAEGRSGFVSVSRYRRDGLKATHWAITEEFEGDAVANAVAAVLARLEERKECAPAKEKGGGEG